MYLNDENNYICGQSKKITIDYTGKKVVVNLGLDNEQINSNGIVYGKVLDHFGCPIKNALVKIMADDYEPLSHTETDCHGIYFFSNIPCCKNYKIFAIAPGQKISNGVNFLINPNSKININFKLKEDINDRSAIIVGDLYDSKNCLPIKDSTIVLFKQCFNRQQTLMYITHTNTYGQFAFTRLKLGTYIMKVYTLGYIDKYYKINITKCSQIVNVVIKMIRDPNKSQGTISGIIKDSSGKPIDKADVILYKVKIDGSLFPIAFTRTNTEGVYLFTNIAIGSYKIKSNKTKHISINICSEDIPNE